MIQKNRRAKAVTISGSLQRHAAQALVLLIFAISATKAQEAGSLLGNVTDPQGNPIPDARVQVFGQDPTPLATAHTGASGEYAFNGIAAGSYVVAIQKDGFRGKTIPVQLSAGTGEMHVALELAGLSQSVVVTAAGEAQMPDEVSRPLTVISHDEILNRNDYSYGDLLNTVPGLTIQNEGGPGQYTTISAHGLPVADTAILIDGLRFRDVSNSQGDASDFIQTLTIISPDHVEILSGSGSSLYGTDAVGGVVNIVSQQGGSPLHGELQVEGGGLGMYRGRGVLGGGALHNRFTWNVGITHVNVLNGVDGHSPWRNTGSQAIANYAVSPRLDILGRFWGTDDFLMSGNPPTNVGILAANIPPTGTIPAIAPSLPSVAAYANGQPPNFGNATFIPNVWDPDNRRASDFIAAALILKGVISPKVNWQASYQRVDTRRVFQNGPGGVGYQPLADNYSRYQGTVDTAGGRFTGVPTTWLTLIGGYEFEREVYQDYQDNNLPSPDLVIESTHAEQRSNAAYFAAQSSLFNHRLMISLSGREQTFDVSLPNFQYAGAISNPYAGVPINAPHALTGDASMAYLFSRSNTKLRGHVGNAYRAPALYERLGGGFYNNPLVPDQVIFTPYGDPNLAPDRFNSVDGGIDQYLFHDRIRVSATIFYTRISQLISFVNALPLPDPFGRISGYMDTSGGISRGEELSIEARPTNTLSLMASYTYTNADTDTDSTVPGYYQMFDLPRHKVSLVVTKQWNQRLDTTFDLHSYSSYLDPYVGYGRAYLFSGYAKANLVASYQLWQKEHQAARVYCKIDNLFNITYYDGGGYREPGLTALAGIRYSF
jgi:vitamin B12 transporter